jgi:hypothetical protein
LLWSSKFRRAFFAIRVTIFGLLVERASGSGTSAAMERRGTGSVAIKARMISLFDDYTGREWLARVQNVR